MTVSYFTGLERQIPAVEAERMMRAAQAAVYPHVTERSAQRMWQGWAATVNRASQRAVRAAGAMFTVDGEAVGVKGLKRWFRRTLGRGLAA